MNQTGDARLHAPAAERNVDAIVAAVAPRSPGGGLALEIAAGSGRHAVALAAALPHLDWRPTDIGDAELASVEAWRAVSGLPNLAPARRFDAVAERWDGPPAAMTYFSNLLHLVSENDFRAVIATTAAALGPGGRAFVYGPFLRADGYASDGDRRFDAELRRRDPAIGYKRLGDVEAALEAAGLAMTDRVEMPANNLMLVADARA